MPSRRCLLLVVCLCLLFGLAYQPQKRIELNLAASSNAKFLTGFFAPEVGSAWTEARSGIWLPGLGGSNLPWRVGLRLSSAGRGRIDAPARVTITVNGAKLDEFSASNEERNYAWEIPPWTFGLNGDFLLQIDSTTFKSPIDQRELGVKIARVWLERTDGVALPSLRDFLLTITLVGGCGLFLRMYSRVGLVRERPITVVQSFDPWQNPRAWILVGFWLVIVLFRGLNRPQGAWWIQTFTFAAVLVLALIWLIARIIPGSLTQRQLTRLSILFGVAALVRIPFDFGRGYETDVSMYMSLAWKTVHYGLQSAYSSVGDVPPSDNPPFLLYPFWVVGRFYQIFLSPLFGRTRLSDPDALRFMLRLPGFVADLITGGLVFRFLQLRRLLSFSEILLVTGAYLLNPALIFDSAYWGQTAAIHSLFMLLSLIAIDRNSWAWAGAMLTAAILTKPQALAIAPIVCLVVACGRGSLRFGVGAAVASFLITAPFLLAGRFGDVVVEYLHTTEFDPFIAVNAHNLWWFVSGGQGWLRDSGALGPLTFRSAGLLFFGAATLLSLVRVWEDRNSLFVAAAYQSLAFFMLNTQMHENHLLAMFAPLVIAAACDRRLWWLYAGFGVTTVANMALHDPHLLTLFNYSIEQMIYGTPALAVTRWLNAAAQMLLFFVFTWRVALPLLSQLRPSDKPASH
jgi:hypothetical protein